VSPKIVMKLSSSISFQFQKKHYIDPEVVTFPLYLVELFCSHLFKEDFRAFLVVKVRFNASENYDEIE
jgi:hypothetical protein